MGQQHHENVNAICNLTTARILTQVEKRKKNCHHMVALGESALRLKVHANILQDMRTPCIHREKASKRDAETPYHHILHVT